MSSELTSVEALEARLYKVEKKLSIARATCFTGCVLAGLIFLSGQARPKPDVFRADTIETNHLSVVDEDGTRRIMLEIDEAKNEPRVLLKNLPGGYYSREWRKQPWALLTAGNNGASFRLIHPEQSVGAIVDSRTAAVYVSEHQNRTPGVMIGLTDKTPTLQLVDAIRGDSMEATATRVTASQGDFRSVLSARSLSVSDLKSGSEAALRP